MARSVLSKRTPAAAGDPDPRPADRPRASPVRRGTAVFFTRRNAFLAAIVLSCCAGMYMMTLWQRELAELDRGSEERTREEELLRRRPPAGTAVLFRPVDLLRGMQERAWAMSRLRSEDRKGVRPPRLALVVGNMDKDPQTLMLLTLAKGLKELRYSITVFALRDGEARFLWEHVHCQVLILHTETPIAVDWSNYEGVILSSLESQRVITSLMHCPFDSIPLIWLVQEDTLAERLPFYENNNLNNLVTIWRTAFSRADVVVFPDFSLPMMYNSLDTGNFYVIPGSPVNVWEAKVYIASNSRPQLREGNGFSENDLIILVIGSYVFYDDLPWEYAASTNALTPAISKIARTKGLGGIIKLLFLCGNSEVDHGSPLQELASRMGLPIDSVKHYGVDGDVNSLLLMADIVLYGSFQEEQSFPPLLLRSMSFGLPVIVPNLDIIRKYLVDQTHGLFFDFEPDTLVTAFSLLIEDKKLSELALKVASSGESLAENMLVSGCVVDYAKLLESVLQFPSDAMLPLNIRHINQKAWAWDLFEKKNEQFDIFARQKDSKVVISIVEFLEVQMDSPEIANITKEVGEFSIQDFPTQSDWDSLSEIEILEDYDRREKEEIEDRTHRNLGSWEDLYQNARKAEKQSYHFDNYERDEIELEKTGQQLCIYEIYNGQGAWPFLHHDSLYRGISLSKGARRPRSDDVDAVARLPILNSTYYRDRLCEFGAMFSIANKVDSIHTIPWIGFQSWQATARKVSLSVKAEDALEHTILENSEGDVIYYWASMDIDQEREEKGFWSMCDILNAGNCRTVFEGAFRLMYGLPEDMAALPPMPDDGDRWSTLHCWVMPTSSYLEFIMFSRMFVDSIDTIIKNDRHHASCFLGSSVPQKKHCYCRVLDVLVNVWAYHSARRMVYLDPSTGEIKEQHLIEQRTGQMWVKYFNITLLKSMDEDLAEEADDGMHPDDGWLWPFTGEVHWQGIFDREREEKYRNKMDKKRKNMEKLLDRQKNGYRQKTLGGKP
ncbi:uncharacterized protein M6B38_118925 [Iris pallida]|uniref:Glycosyl transferase family 1 domain-containing protein n=1 Tax=Iris pallida TaxID=29817 RepID=A0AAX6HIF7_IRIPA|nr:uncharacterized protein M6B38_118925 [Iris pallida]